MKLALYVALLWAVWHTPDHFADEGRRIPLPLSRAVKPESSRAVQSIARLFPFLETFPLTRHQQDRAVIQNR